jgi:hypothetical protein
MIELQERIALMTRLATYMSSDDENWVHACELAERANGWFTQQFIQLAVKNIVTQFLNPEKLRAWLAAYPELQRQHGNKPCVGIVTAGNIPLVGFHDFLSVFMAGFPMRVKLSSKDNVLLQHIINILTFWDARVADQVQVADMLKGCDAYIATGSNNSARYFEYYFSKYPSIIRKNRTSVAVLDGNESDEELSLLAEDVHSFFGLGCRNVTKIFVPAGYNFEKLLTALGKYKYLADHNKYKNNYDYQLALFLLNKVPYMSNENILLVEGKSPFAAISVVHYEYYDQKEELLEKLKTDNQLQCITQSGKREIGSGTEPVLGKNQVPGLFDYADGVDTMAFLSGLIK